jgi:hypothetical protein
MRNRSRASPTRRDSRDVVGRQRGPRRAVVPVQAGQHPQARHGLEAVAHAQRQTAALEELEQRVVEPEADLVREDEARAQVVAEGEAADEGQDGVIGEARAAALQEVEEMDALRRGPGQAEGGLRLLSQLSPRPVSTSTRTRARAARSSAGTSDMGEGLLPDALHGGTPAWPAPATPAQRAGFLRHLPDLDGKPGEVGEEARGPRRPPRPPAPVDSENSSAWRRAPSLSKSFVRPAPRHWLGGASARLPIPGRLRLRAVHRARPPGTRGTAASPCAAGGSAPT